MAAELWRSEALRANAFLAQREREREALNASVFARIRAHVHWRDHELKAADAQLAADTDAESHGDEPPDDTVELALEFLSGVDEQDMKTLLDAVPASSSAPVSSSSAITTTATEAPLQMPLHLQSPLNPSLALALAPPADVLGADAGVAALMDELQLDPAAFASPPKAKTTLTPAEEEHKTEESTPPAHVQRGLVAEQPPPQPRKTLVAGLVDQDAVAAEMLSWVSGMRDPDVVKRKETLRPNRRQVTRLGVTSYVDSSDDSQSPNDSDFSPTEEPEEELEERLHAAEELLPDDYLDDRMAPQPRRRRRRLKQRAERQKKTPPKRDTSHHQHQDQREENEKLSVPVTTATATTAAEAPTATTTAARRLVVDESSSSDEAPSAAAASGSTAIDLRSDDDEDDDGTEGASMQQAEKETSNSMVLRFKMSPSLRASLSRESEEKSATDDNEASTAANRLTTSTETKATEEAAASHAEEEDGGYDTDDLGMEAEPDLLPTDNDLVMKGDANENDGDVSDTGTLDLSDDDAEPEITSTHREGERTPPSRSSPSSSSTLQPVAPDEKLSLSPPKTAAAASVPAPENEVSDAETVNFEDVSEIDFGSSASEADYDGDVVILGNDGDDAKTTALPRAESKADAADDDDEEAEFDQFFSAKKPPKKSTATKKETVNAPAKPLVRKTPKGTEEKQPTIPAAAAAEKTKTKMKKLQSPQTTPSSGSNGLRTVRNLNTTTVPKGRYQHTRRAVRLLDEHGLELPTAELDPKQAQMQRSRLRPSDMMAAPEGTAADASGRYLGYARPMVDDDKRAGGPRQRAPPAPTQKELFRASAKLVRERMERRDKAHGVSTPLEAAKTLSRPVFRTTDNDDDDMPLSKSLSKAAVYVPPRQPQLDVYQATGAQSQIDLPSSQFQLQHKRPVTLSRQIEEAKRQGKELVRFGIPVELDEKAPIPKKAKPPPPSAAAVANAKRLAHRQQEEEESLKNDRKTKNNVKRKPGKDAESSLEVNRRRVESGEPPQKKPKKPALSDNGKSSYYGPQSSTHSDPKRGRERERAREQEKDRNGGRNSRKRESLSPRRSSDSSYHSSKTRRSRDSSRSRSRSPSRSDRRHSHSHNHKRSHRDEQRYRRDSHSRSRSRSPDSRPRSRSRSTSRSGRGDERRRREEDNSRYSSSRSSSGSGSGSRVDGGSMDRNDRRVEHDPRQHKVVVYEEAEPEPEFGFEAMPVDAVSSPERQLERLSSTSSAVEPERRHLPKPNTAPPTYHELNGSAVQDDRGFKPMTAAANNKNPEAGKPEEQEEGYISDSDDGFVVLDDDDEDGSKARTRTSDIRYRLDDVAVDWDALRRTVYVTNLTPMMDEPQLAELFAPFGLARNPSTGYPAVDVFLCQRNLRNRGDARVTLKHREAAETAVKELNAMIFKTSRINVRLMDANTMRILTLQHDTYRDTWTCANVQCRAKLSIWTTRCSSCYRHRVFPEGGAVVRNDNDWLCSICFTSNDFFAPKCRSCKSELPERTDGR
ncbi:hypothetical protein PINS_up012379 [Pythium insidiosum]|nr:hypothetical protein PINS_up012379 [Pythium insidiosum]